MNNGDTNIEVIHQGKSIKFPLIADEKQYVILMKNFAKAFESVDLESSSSSFLNSQYIKELFEEINQAQQKINKLQSLTDNNVMKVASLFLSVQKNQIYEPIFSKILEIKQRCYSIIESEIKKREFIIADMENEQTSLTKQLEQLKNEINSIKTESLNSIHEELIKMNDFSINLTHQCISYQNEFSKLGNDISILHPTIGEKSEKIKSLIVNQSLLRSELATTVSQINAITTDCATLAIDSESCSKKVSQEKINLHQKNLELSTIENEIKESLQKSKENEILIQNKKDEIVKIDESINDISSQIESIKIKISQISDQSLDEVSYTSEAGELITRPGRTKMENELEKLKKENEKLLSEKDRLLQRSNQLDVIIEKKNKMISDDTDKIEKKRLRYEELQETFQLRKIMLLTAFDDIDRKYDKLKDQIKPFEMKSQSQSPASYNSYDSEMSSNDSQKSNLTIFQPYSKKKILEKIQNNTKMHSSSQTPQITQKYSKLFPSSNSTKRKAPTFTKNPFSPLSQKF